MILTDVSDTTHADSLALFALNIEILLDDVTVSTPDWELSAPLRGTPAEPRPAEVGAGQCVSGAR